MAKAKYIFTSCYSQVLLLNVFDFGINLKLEASAICWIAFRCTVITCVVIIKYEACDHYRHHVFTAMTYCGHPMAITGHPCNRLVYLLWPAMATTGNLYVFFNNL